MQTQSTTSAAPLTTPRVLRWQVTKANRASQLHVGDVLRFDPTAPRDQRVTVERSTSLHAGHLDKLQLLGTIEPIDGTIADHRAALVLTLVHDRQMMQEAS